MTVDYKGRDQRIVFVGTNNERPQIYETQYPVENWSRDAHFLDFMVF